jgi:hypothetical protein
MHFGRKCLIAVVILLVAHSALAQEPYRSSDPDLMVRFSYDNFGIVSREDVAHMCMAVSRKGDYRTVRILDKGQTERLSGKLSREEFTQLSRLLRAPEFRSLSGVHGGLLRQEAERFAAEIPSDDFWREDLEQDAWRLSWLDADGESPFPESVSKVVVWLQHFQPKNGKSFEYTEYPDVCPKGGLRLLQPSVAENSRP